MELGGWERLFSFPVKLPSTPISPKLYTCASYIFGAFSSIYSFRKIILSKVNK